MQDIRNDFLVFKCHFFPNLGRFWFVSIRNIFFDCLKDYGNEILSIISPVSGHDSDMLIPQLSSVIRGLFLCSANYTIGLNTRIVVCMERWLTVIIWIIVCLLPSSSQKFKMKLFFQNYGVNDLSFSLIGPSQIPNSRSSTVLRVLPPFCQSALPLEH